MTLHELERLIRRIEEALERPPSGGLQKLAGDYTAAGRATVTRLGQCAQMLEKGEEHQALQLAEAQPALLDLITLLSFRRSPNWRTLCQGENLPTPEPLDVRAVRRLNELYAKGIDKDHALYRDYRRAVMLNDDAHVLGILRAIVRLNPEDQNARHEFDRLEQKQRVDKARELEKLVRGGGKDSEKITRLAEEVAAAHVAVDPVIWDKTQEIRARVLMRHVREAQKAGDLRDVQQTLETLQGLRNHLIKVDREALEELDRWATAEGLRHKEEAGRRAAMEHLASVVQRVDLERAGRKRSLVELRAASALLENAWRQVERLRTQVRPDVATKAQRTREALDSEIKHRVHASRRLAFVTVAAIVLVCVAAAWVAYSRQATRAAAAQIHAAIADRRVGDVEKALANSTNSVSSPALAQARESAAEFLGREMALKATADQALAAINVAALGNFTNAPAEKIAADFERARKAVGAIAADFRGVAGSDLAKKENAWNEFVERERGLRATRLASALTPLENTAEKELQFTIPAERALQSSERLLRELESARKLTEPAVLRPKQEVLFRLETLQARVQKVLRDATNFFEARETLAGATNWQGYNAGLQQLISSGFTPAPQRETAAAFAALNLSSKSVLGPLLLPHAPGALLEPPHVGRVPQNVLPAEQEIQNRLRDDQNIHGISRMEIEVKALPADNPKRKRMVFLRGELQRRITRKSGLVYDPVESPSTLVFLEKEMGSLDFTVEEPTSTAERDLFERAGLNRLIDPASGLYQTSLLQALEEINQDRKANPLFRAFLFMQICEIMEKQPAQWGVVWSPTLARDRAELNRLGTTQVHSGDWMIPAKVAQRGSPLLAHFERTALNSYSRESAFFKRLLPKVVEAGARVVGYVNAQGEPVLNETSTARWIWGFPSVSKPAEVALNRRSARPAIPFSPLFVLAGDAPTLIDETLRALSYAPASVGMPESLPMILREAP